jgi:hypothetical protein
LGYKRLNENKDASRASSAKLAKPKLLVRGVGPEISLDKISGWDDFLNAPSIIQNIL